MHLKQSSARMSEMKEKVSETTGAGEDVEK